MSGEMNSPDQIASHCSSWDGGSLLLPLTCKASTVNVCAHTFVSPLFLF